MVERRGQLTPGAGHVGLALVDDSQLGAFGHLRARLVHPAAVDLHQTGHHGPPGALAAGKEPALMKKLIESNSRSRHLQSPTS